MKAKFLRVLRVIVICIFSCAVFVSSGYFYLKSNIKETEKNESEIPYTSPDPENSGVMLDIAGNKTFMYFDFTDEKLSVMIPDNIIDSSADIIYGYPVNYNIKADYKFVSDIIDFIDGINLTVNNETLRYTGVQVTEMLTHTSDDGEFKRTVLTEIMKKISEYGFKKENFIYIIENSETNLTVPDCYYWCDYMKKICKNGRVIN